MDHEARRRGKKERERDKTKGGENVPRWRGIR